MHVRSPYFCMLKWPGRHLHLLKGLSAMDLIRNTLDQYLNGMLGYGMVGKINWQSVYNSSDSFPSLIMAACYYIIDTKDLEWANKKLLRN